MTPLEQNFLINSPRLTPRRAGFAAYAIWGGALLLFLALLSQAFFAKGVGAWAVGLAYVGYDTALLIFVGWQTLAILKTPKPAVAVDGPKASVGVVIAAYNEASVIEATVEALRSQDQPPEVIVIADDGSTDLTADVLASVYQFDAPSLGRVSQPSPIAPEVRWLRLPHGGKARALNAAIQCITTDIILTVDADTIMAKGAVAAMRQAFDTEPELVVATGVLHPICGHDIRGRIFQWFQTYEFVRNFLSRYAWMRQQSLLLISGAFSGFRREALLTVGGFDTACLVEDYEVIHRLHRYGVEHGVDWRTRVIGGAQASTDSPGRLMPFLRQRRRWFGGFLQTQYWNRDMIGNGRFGRLGIEMLPVKALDTVQPIYGLSAFALLIIFATSGSFRIATPILIAMGVKITIDLAYLLWSLHLFRLWTGKRLNPVAAVAAAIIEPFSFQLLRHAGAAWGWVLFLSRNQSWGSQERAAIKSRLKQGVTIENI